MGNNNNINAVENSSPNNTTNNSKRRRSSKTDSNNFLGKKDNLQKSKYNQNGDNDAKINNNNKSSSNKKLATSSSFINSLSQSDSFSKKPRSFGSNDKKKNNKNKNSYNNFNEKSNLSLHSYNIEQIKSTFPTSDDNIIRQNRFSQAKKADKPLQTPTKLLSAPQGKYLYTNFKGDSIYYSTIIKPSTYGKLISMDKKEGKQPFYWPFNENKPCPIKFEYTVNKGKIADPINCFFLSSEEPDAESINFKNCENKDLSIYFLQRILAADYDLIDRIVANLSNVAIHILKQIILSILKGWNIYLVCDIDLIRRCVDVFYKLRGFKMYYLNRPIITIIGFQNNLECKNCFNYGYTIEKERKKDEDVEDVDMTSDNVEEEEEEKEKGEEKGDDDLDEISSNATTDSDDGDDSATMDILLGEDNCTGTGENTDITMDESETFDPRAMALDYLSKIHTTKD
ncbi:hypothetical protein ACO0SA_002843 [Hanseniaspora valbyensis]